MSLLFFIWMHQMIACIVWQDQGGLRGINTNHLAKRTSRVSLPQKRQKKKEKQVSFSPVFFPPNAKKKNASSCVCESDSGINRWNAHGKSESQHCNHPPYVKWPVMLCHAAQESCHIYQQCASERAESKSAVIGRPCAQ